MEQERINAGRVCRPFPAGLLPVCPAGEDAGTRDCGDGVLQRVWLTVSADRAEEYLSRLRDEGWVLIRSEEIGACRFSSWQREGLCAEVFYHTAWQELRVAGIPYNPYAVHDCFRSASRDPENQTAAGLPRPARGVCVPTLTQVGLNYERVINGMSYVLRTGAGSFLLIDGGYGGQGEAQKLRDLLYEMNGGERPDIAAWILTHPHCDHIDAMGEFAAAYGEELVPRRLIYNFVSEEELRAGANYTVPGYRLLCEAIRGPWSSTELIKPRTGNRLFLDGAELLVLHCQEDGYPCYPEHLARNNGNSLCFLLTAGGRRVLFTADLAGAYMRHIGEWYGSDLRCDVLQVVHHGRTHGYIPTYAQMEPTICLWPASRPSVEQYGAQPYNQWLTEHVPRHYFCYEGSITLALPDLRPLDCAAPIMKGENQ